MRSTDLRTGWRGRTADLLAFLHRRGADQTREGTYALSSLVLPDEDFTIVLPGCQYRSRGLIDDDLIEEGLGALVQVHYHEPL